MLRVYSIMQLQQVWTKPAAVDEDDECQSGVLSPTLDVVHEEPEDLTENAPAPVTITTAEEQTSEEESDPANNVKAAEEPVAKNEEQPAPPPPVPTKDEPAKPTEEPAKEEQPAKPVEEPVKKVEEPVKEQEPVKEEEVKELPQQREIPRDTKRDSKVSTMSKDSTFVLTTIAEEGRRTSQSSSERKLASHSPSMTRTSTMDDSMPPTPISLKPSRSTQIQSKLSSGRKNISRKLKRAFSVSNNTASSKKRFTL